MSVYPSKEELKAIKNFEGTPKDFVEYLESIWRNGAGISVDSESMNGEVVVTAVTGGWSGCEEIIGVVGKTMFSFFYHSKWERGGLYEYRIRDAFWEGPAMQLGYLKNLKKEGK